MELLTVGTVYVNFLIMYFIEKKAVCDILKFYPHLLPQIFLLPARVLYGRIVGGMPGRVRLLHRRGGQGDLGSMKAGGIV